MRYTHLIHFSATSTPFSIADLFTNKSLRTVISRYFLSSHFFNFWFSFAETYSFYKNLAFIFLYN